MPRKEPQVYIEHISTGDVFVTIKNDVGVRTAILFTPEEFAAFKRKLNES